MFTVDARGLSCPEPVVRVQKAVKADPEGGKVTVDAVVAMENIKRFAAARGYAVTVEESAGEYTLTLKK